MTQRSFAVPLGNLGLFRFDVWHVSLFLGHKKRLGGASPQRPFLGQGPGVPFFMWRYWREKGATKIPRMMVATSSQSLLFQTSPPNSLLIVFWKSSAVLKDLEISGCMKRE